MRAGHRRLARHLRHDAAREGGIPLHRLRDVGLQQFDAQGHAGRSAPVKVAHHRTDHCQANQRSHAREGCRALTSANGLREQHQKSASQHQQSRQPEMPDHRRQGCQPAVWRLRIPQTQPGESGEHPSAQPLGHGPQRWRQQQQTHPDRTRLAEAGQRPQRRGRKQREEPCQQGHRSPAEQPGQLTVDRQTDLDPADTQEEQPKSPQPAEAQSKAGGGWAQTNSPKQRGECQRNQPPESGRRKSQRSGGAQ